MRMCRMRILPLLILLLALAVACGDTLVASPGGASQSVYLPYVEAAEVPDQVLQGEAFTVKLRLSSAAAPGLLNGVTAQPTLDSYTGWIREPLELELESSDIRLHPWIANPRWTGALAEDYEFKVIFYVAGQHQLYIESAAEPSSGGIQDVFYFTPRPVYPVNPHATWLTYEIEVLPAP